jgi:LTXXQ motif family protein
MSKSGIGLAVVFLAIALPTRSYAAPHGGPGGGHGGGSHFGGGPHFGGGMRFGGGPHFGGGMRFGGGPHFGGGMHLWHGPRFGGGPHLGGFGHIAHFGRIAHFGHVAHFSRGARFGHIAHFGGGAGFGHVAHFGRAAGFHSAWNSHLATGALRNTSALRDPNTRAYVTALGAMAGLRNTRSTWIGWWQHNDGGYGWVGPLFWPFAYDDLYDYVMWGYAPPFWQYGYDDIFAALFAPYGYEELLGYLSQPTALRPGRSGHSLIGPRHIASDQLAQMCGRDSHDVVGLPIDQIKQDIALTDEQRGALDDLANALTKAAQDIEAACPTDISLTAPGRVVAMQWRLEAIIAAVGTVQPPLDKFYGLLNDEQKARFNALDEGQHKNATSKGNSDSLLENCGAQSGVTEWPGAEIDRKLHLADTQRNSLAALQDATAKAADMLKSFCHPESALTPPARLAAAGNRLRTMLEAVKLVRSALEEFYGTLSDEQKAQFEAIGRQSIGPRAELMDRHGTN